MQHLFSDSSGRRGSVTRRQRQRGLSLIEFMISITIGLILLVGLVLLFSQQSATQIELEKSSRQIENGRYAMQVLKEDVQLAGYYGEFYDTKTLAAPTTMPDPCLSAMADLKSAMAFPVQGYNSPASLTTIMPNCALSAANYKQGTDILVVRRADATRYTGTGDLTPGQVYLQSGLNAVKTVLGYTLDTAASKDADPVKFNLITRAGTPAPLHPYLVHVYYISPCSVPTNGSTCSIANTDDGGVSVPTLKRLELSVAGGAPKFSTTALVEGIENMQLTFGVDTAVLAGVTNPDADDGVADNEVDASGVPLLVPGPAKVENWAEVMTVRIHLLARNNDTSAGFTDDRSYQLGAVLIPAANDRFKRHVFSQMVRVVNSSGRRGQ